jgi:DNA-binding NarL/FixJ family response regulator
VKKRISMVLIDDRLSAREGVVARIRAQPGFHILAATAETEAALQKVRQTKPDLVLLNLRRESADSLALAGALHGKVPASHVIIMSMDPLHEDVASFVRAGVSGFIMADASLDKFLSTIHSVALGIQVLPKELTRSLFAQLNGYRVGT